MLSPQLQGASQTPLVESEELRALRSNQLHLKLEKGLLIYTYNGQGPARWIVPTDDHRGVMLTHAHDSPVRGHQGYRATLQTHQQVAYWPSMFS